MVFSANFNNISAISLGYVLLVPPMVEEAGGFGENHRILSNRSTQNHVGEPRYFEINRVIVDSKKSHTHKTKDRVALH
jgi:hypothetical protein